MEVPVAVAGWANHARTFMSLIESYKTKELFCDCTLACDRKFFRAHKMILAMSSELFENIFLTTEDKNPVIILHEIEAWQVECLLNYMYKGETRVSDAHFISLCKVAKSLQIKGFDKLELYREAVKQSGRKDSRLITPNEESKSETSLDATKENISLRSCYYLHDKEQLEHTSNIFSYNAIKKPTSSASSSSSSSSPSFQPNEDRNSPPREALSSPISKERAFSIDPNLSSKSPPQRTKSPSDDTTSLSSPEKCSHSSSSGYNFKKKYLLSMSQESVPSPNSQSQLSEEISAAHRSSDQERKPLCKEEYPTFPSVAVCKSELHPSTEVPIEAKSSTGQKALRGPPPLLRIMYNSSPEDEEPKVENEKMPLQFKQETPPPFPYDYSLSYNRLPHLDDYFHTSLISEPWNDPLLQKIPTNKRKRVRGPKSWEFLLRLLRSPESNPSLIKWENEDAGVFRLIRPEIIALRWGRRTGKHIHDILSYESFSRGLRYHYATGALCAVSEKSFVYQFGPKAQDALKATRQVKSETTAVHQ